MKKKVLMSLILLAIIGTSAVFAQTPTLDKLTFTNVGTTASPAYSVSAINNSISDVVVIPDTYNGNHVTNISSFRNITGITSITFPNTLTTFADNSFSGCTGLTSITIPESVTNINYNSFNGCTNLTSVTFQGANVTFNSAFPGDLRAKYQTGGAGIYTRPAGSNTWTRTGDAPITVNTSLDGVWEYSDGRRITISGNSGVINRFETSPSARTQDAINKNHIRIGSQEFRNVSSTGNLTWSAQIVGFMSNTNTPNIVTGIEYRNCRITMSTDGRTLTITGADGGGFNYTLTRW